MKLDLNARHELYGNTIAEHIQSFVCELPFDAVGLWHIILAGLDGFGLTGDRLIEFTRLCIFALLEAGAKPVIGGSGTPYEWILQDQYGESKEEIADAVIEEWVFAGKPDDAMDLLWLVGFWFALPNPEYPEYVVKIENPHSLPQHGMFYRDVLPIVHDIHDIHDIRKIDGKVSLNPVRIGKYDLYVAFYPKSGHQRKLNGERENYNYVTFVAETGKNKIISSYPSDAIPSLPENYYFRSW